MVLNHTSYRSYLKQVLTDRAVRNPSYSLRAFATTLGLAPSMVSGLLNGKKNLSRESALEVCQRLGLKPKAQEYFCLLVQLETAKTDALRQSLRTRLQAIAPQNTNFNLSVDQFNLIAEWYHLPILELSELSGFEFAPRSIAQKIGITIFEAENALSRLQRLGLLKKNSSGKWQKAHKDLLVRSQIPNEALKSYHRRMLEKTAVSVDQHLPNTRVSSTRTFLFNPENLPEALELTRSYQAQLLTLAEKYGAQSSATSQVFHSGVYLFQISDESQAKGKKVYAK